MKYIYSGLLGILLTGLISIDSFAQSNLRISSQRDDDGDRVFSIENRNSQDYHIVVRFTSLIGYSCNCNLPYGGNIGSGTSRLFKLVRKEGFGSSDYNYSWSYRAGWVADKVKNVDYIIPVAPGKEVKMMQLQSLEKYMGQEEKERNGTYHVGFYVEEEEVVYAARRGKVIKIVDDYDMSDASNLDYSTRTNYILIRHDDNSYARYSILKKGGFKVAEGEFVQAGMPIATAGGERFNSGPQFRMTTYYYTWDRSAPKDKAYTRSYVRMQFANGEGEPQLLEPGEVYTSLHTEALITQDMSKREKKKRKKKG